MGNPGAGKFEVFLSVLRSLWRDLRETQDLISLQKDLSVESSTLGSLLGWRRDRREQEWKKVAQAGGYFGKPGEKCCQDAVLNSRYGKGDKRV